MAERPDELPNTADTLPNSATKIAPGKPEAPLEVLIGRWLMLGCAATALVLVVAALLLGWVTVNGVFEK